MTPYATTVFRRPWKNTYRHRPEMNTLNEIRIKLTEFGRQLLRNESHLNMAALINTTAKEILALLNEPAEPERWKPPPHTAYYFIDTDIEVGETAWVNDKRDRARWEAGNCFPTHKEAEQAREKVKEVLLHLHK